MAKSEVSTKGSKGFVFRSSTGATHVVFARVLRAPDGTVIDTKDSSYELKLGAPPAGKVTAPAKGAKATLPEAALSSLYGTTYEPVKDVAPDGFAILGYFN